MDSGRRWTLRPEPPLLRLRLGRAVDVDPGLPRETTVRPIASLLRDLAPDRLSPRAIRRRIEHASLRSCDDSEDGECDTDSTRDSGLTTRCGHDSSSLRLPLRPDTRKEASMTRLIHGNEVRRLSSQVSTGRRPLTRTKRRALGTHSVKRYCRRREVVQTSNCPGDGRHGATYRFSRSEVRVLHSGAVLHSRDLERRIKLTGDAGTYPRSGD
jgi:hypothetical protein